MKILASDFSVCVHSDYIENVTVEICQAGVCGQQHPKSPDVEFEELVSGYCTYLIQCLNIL